MNPGGSGESGQGECRPYWAEGMAAAPELSSAPSPRAEVAVIGCGYTGLNAAIETARGGRSTLALDAGEPGFGCSARNGGQVSDSVRLSFERLAARHGAQRARAIRAEGARALEWIGERIREEAIECDFRRCGRFHAAHAPARYEQIAREAERLRREEGIDAQAVPRSEQLRELGSQSYFGGVVFSGHGALHPAKYHRGLLERALEAGAEVAPRCAALSLRPEAEGGFRIETEKGTVRARDVIVATNGYTGELTPWLRRRVIPIASYLIATEPLPPETIKRLFPSGRVVTDTREVLYYFRACPQRRRVIFGGRVSAGSLHPRDAAPRLRKAMSRIFPELERCAITHAWSGTVAYSFDSLAHIGSHEGIHYAMGYCGSGVSMASYLGMKVGRKLLGGAEGKTAFDGLAHPTLPFYRGNPWFLPAAVAWRRWRDERWHRKAGRMR